MSAKCKYSLKFLPLVKAKANSSTNEEFKDFLNNYFYNPNKIYEDFKRGSEPVVPIVEPEVEKVIVPNKMEIDVVSSSSPVTLYLEILLIMRCFVLLKMKLYQDLFLIKMEIMVKENL